MTVHVGINSKTIHNHVHYRDMTNYRSVPDKYIPLLVSLGYEGCRICSQMDDKLQAGSKWPELTAFVLDNPPDLLDGWHALEVRVVGYHYPESVNATCLWKSDLYVRGE